MIIFLYNTIEKCQSSTTNNTSFEAVLHKSIVEKVVKMYIMKRKTSMTNFQGLSSRAIFYEVKPR